MSEVPADPGGAPAEPQAPDQPGVVRFVERKGLVTSFAWGFSEATLFFFLPDIAVGAVALVNFRKGLKAVVAAVAGAVLGGLVLWAVARIAGPGIHELLTRLPAIPDRFFADVRQSLLDDGGLAVVTGPGRGIPYKLYAADWGVLGWNPLSLALWTIPARALRIALTALLAGAAGAVARRLFGAHNTKWFLLAYAVVWVVVYAAYFITVGL